MLYKIARKIKFWGKIVDRREDVFIMLLLVLVGLGSFGLGKLSAITEHKEPVKIQNTTARVGALPLEHTQSNTGEEAGTNELTQNSGKYVASVHGGKYHHPWCSGAQRIKESNKIWFDTKKDAERAGYEPAKNCKGL